MFKYLLFSFIVLSFYYVTDVSSQSQHGDLPVSQPCLGCICEAISGCNITRTCPGDVCGPFRITWPYWADGGKPTVGNQSPEESTAFGNCAYDPYCSAIAVQGYMQKFQQDCNGDGKIDCDDFVAIHKLGGYGCRSPLPDFYGQRYEQCVFLSNLDKQCLRCLCFAATACNVTIGCVNGYCGPYKISRIYWADAGKIILPEDQIERAGAYEDCAINFHCAQKIMRNYLEKYGRDCNGDGRVNCEDYSMINFNGGYQCNAPLNRTDAGRKWLERYYSCYPRTPDEEY